MTSSRTVLEGCKTSQNQGDTSRFNLTTAEIAQQAADAAAAGRHQTYMPLKLEAIQAQALRA